MKSILDVEDSIQGDALGAIFRVRAQNPDQPVGKEHGIQDQAAGIPVVVIRNLNSYTVRESQIGTDEQY